MSAQHADTAAFPPDGSVPRAEWERTSTGGRLRWFPSKSTTKVAKFRVVTDDGIATLQHIREIVTSQRYDSYATIDENPELADVPRPLREIVEADGFTVAREVEA